MDDQSFGKQYDSEQPGASIINNILNKNRDSFDRNGIKLVPDNQPADIVNNDSVDSGHNTVKQTAMHQLKSKK